MTIPMPPAPAGTTAETLTAQYTYLFLLAERLNLALDAADGGSSAKTMAEGMTRAAKKELNEGLSALRSQIIKTAKLVRKEMDVLETQLRSEYLAVSDFGTFRESIEGRVTAMAGSIEQLITYGAELTDELGGMGEAFERYRIETAGYIKQGIIGYDGAVPVIGIAIGQDIRLTGQTERVDGKDYDVIDKSSNMSIWTPEKLAFYINGAETAYFSNGALNTANVTVSGRMTLGGWELSHGSGLTVRWIG